MANVLLYSACFLSPRDISLTPPNSFASGGSILLQFLLDEPVAESTGDAAAPVEDGFGFDGDGGSSNVRRLPIIAFRVSGLGTSLSGVEMVDVSAAETEEELDVAGKADMSFASLSLGLGEIKMTRTKKDKTSFAQKNDSTLFVAPHGDRSCGRELHRTVYF